MSKVLKMIPLFVIVVLVVLVASAYPEARDYQLESRAKSNAAEVQLFVEQYAMENDGFFPTQDAVIKHFCDPSCRMTNPFTGGRAVGSNELAPGEVTYATSGNPPDAYEIHAHGKNEHQGNAGDGVILILSRVR